MEFKQLEIKPEGNWFKRTFTTPHAKRTAVYILIGALVGVGFFYFSQGRHMETIKFGDVAQSLIIGGFMGFFITNSPCARGRC